MTYLLTQAGSRAAVESVLCGMLVDMVFVDGADDVAGGGPRVATCLEALPPEAYADGFECLLDLRD